MRLKIACLSVIIVIMTLPSQLEAETLGSLKGVVTDKEGNPIEGVNITVTSLRYISMRMNVKSNAKGEFTRLDLKPDYYEIRGEKEGYHSVFKEIRVRFGMATDASFQMEKAKNARLKSPPGEKKYRKGNDWFARSFYEQAAKSYRQAIELEPDNPIYYNNLGLSLTYLERYNEAIAAYTRMLELQPESYTAAKSAGDLLGIQKKHQEALPYFKKAADLSPDDPEAFYSLGECQLNTGAISGALASFTKTIEIEPGYAQAYYQLGMLYVNQNNKEEALKNLEKFIKLAPFDPNAAVAKQLVEHLKQKNG